MTDQSNPPIRNDEGPAMEALSRALHFIEPAPFDLVVVVPSESEQDFHPLPWFGPEVSVEPAYRRRHLALKGAPDARDVDVTNRALNRLLDLLEDRLTTWPGSHEPMIPDASAADVTPRLKAPAPEPEPEVDQEIGDLHIQDAVIRELARSLQPRQR